MRGEAASPQGRKASATLSNSPGLPPSADAGAAPICSMMPSSSISPALRCWAAFSCVTMFASRVMVSVYPWQTRAEPTRRALVGWGFRDVEVYPILAVRPFWPRFNISFQSRIKPTTLAHWEGAPVSADTDLRKGKILAVQEHIVS